MRAMADVRRFVIETDEMRLEMEDTVPIGRRSIDVTVTPRRRLMSCSAYQLSG